MKNFNWLAFEEEIKHSNRFFPKENQVLEFIDQIYEDKIISFAIGTNFFRSRLLVDLRRASIGEDGSLQGFTKEQSMAPSSNIATAQRASPKGISYLYLSQDEYTAIAETRPGIFSYISLAEINVVKELKIFDLWFDLQDNEIITTYKSLAMQFAVVISEMEKEIDYLPMQYIAEYIKNKGADGIRFISYQSLGGKNVVLFNQDKVSFTRSSIFYNINTAYTLRNISNPEKKALCNKIKSVKIKNSFIKEIKGFVVRSIKSENISK
jgi:RES domain